MTALERRCHLLLRAYPAWYRAERGDEILGTLLEAGPPDRSWPTSRDSRALIVGGLRVRAGMHLRLTTAAALRQAVLLAAVIDARLMLATTLVIAVFFSSAVAQIYPHSGSPAFPWYLAAAKSGSPVTIQRRGGNPAYSADSWALYRCLTSCRRRLASRRPRCGRSLPAVSASKALPGVRLWPGAGR